jgi:hypothetical protein
VGDDGVKSLVALTALDVLDLEYTEVGDEGVKALAALTAITTLRLDGTAVGDEGVESLAALPVLSYLSLDNTALLKDAGVKALMHFLPFTPSLCRVRKTQ